MRSFPLSTIARAAGLEEDEIPKVIYNYLNALKVNAGQGSKAVKNELRIAAFLNAEALQARTMLNALF